MRRWAMTLAALTWLGLKALAQGGDFADRLDVAKSLYYSGAWPAAEQALSRLADELERRPATGAMADGWLSEIEAYRVLCNVSMDRVNAEWAVDVYESRFPNAPEMPMLKFAMASRQFDRCEYDKAAPVFESIDEKRLYPRQRTEFRFKKAFCQMRQGRFDLARSGFGSIVDAPRSAYTYPAVYYLGFVHYREGRFEEAISCFERAGADSRFAVLSQYYCVECSFMLSRHKFVTDNGPSLMASVPDELRPNLARMISESFFVEGDAANARKFLALCGDSGKGFTRSDHYFSGLLSYGMKNWDEAAASFEMVVGERDSLAQSAWYHLAGCYLQCGNRNAAIPAFREASQIEADPAVREDAFFNYARLSFDVNSDFSGFEEYMKEFPDSGREDVINSYLAASFIMAKDYSSAVRALRKTKVPTPESGANLQRAAFLRGVQLVEDASYGTAVKFFDISLENGRYDAALANLARFWKAESLYGLERYQDADALYAGLKEDPLFKAAPEYPLALYALAYCRFNSSRWQEAAELFGEYSALGMADDRDARLRIGDSYYRMGDYQSAAAAFDDVRLRYPASTDVYPDLLSAMSHGKMGGNDRKIEILASLTREHRDSPLYQTALYEMGLACEESDRDEEGSECFLKLIGTGPDGQYYAPSLMALAAINLKAGRSEKAIGYYKTVVEECPLSPEFQPALSGMESVYRDLYRPDDFLAYLDESGLASARTDAEREKLLFEAAERLYSKKYFGKAVTSYQTFLSTCQGSPNAPVALWHLAVSLQETGRKEAAIDTYRKAMECRDNRQVVREASIACADLLFKLRRWGRAAAVYTEIIKMPVSESCRINAIAARMRCNFNMHRKDESITDAQTLVERNGVNETLRREARYVLVKGYIAKGMRAEAGPLLRQLAISCDDAWGAEARYLIIYDAFNSGRSDEVRSLVQAFSETGTKQVEWLAKSYRLLGDILTAGGDTLNAAVHYQTADSLSVTGKEDQR